MEIRTVVILALVCAGIFIAFIGLVVYALCKMSKTSSERDILEHAYWNSIEGEAEYQKKKL